MAYWKVNIICPSCLLAVNDSENQKNTLINKSYNKKHGSYVTNSDNYGFGLAGISKGGRKFVRSPHTVAICVA